MPHPHWFSIKDFREQAQSNPFMKGQNIPGGHPANHKRLF